MFANTIAKLQLIVSLLICNICTGATIEPETIRLGIYAGFKDRFPNTQGIMWSDRVLVDIFTQAGYQVKINEYPARRLGLTLKRSGIDTFFGTDSSQLPYRQDFLRSRLPVSLITWYIYFNHQQGWQPQWPPDATLLSKTGKSKQSSESLKAEWGLNISQSSSFGAIVKMVNFGRADYWLDNLSGIRTLAPQLLKSEAEGFSYQPLFSRPIYYFFPKSRRGWQLENIYHQGLLALLETGDYQRTYYRFDLENDDYRSAEQTIKYLRENYPQLKISPQKSPLP